MAESLRSDTIAVPHGFFTRRGGVSTGPFASLSLGDRLAYDSHDVLTALTWVAARTTR